MFYVVENGLVVTHGISWVLACTLCDRAGRSVCFCQNGYMVSLWSY